MFLYIICVKFAIDQPTHRYPASKIAQRIQILQVAVPSQPVGLIFFIFFSKLVPTFDQRSWRGSRPYLGLVLQEDKVRGNARALALLEYRINDLLLGHRKPCSV